MKKFSSAISSRVCLLLCFFVLTALIPTLSIAREFSFSKAIPACSDTDPCHNDSESCPSDPESSDDANDEFLIQPAQSLSLRFSSLILIPQDNAPSDPHLARDLKPPRA